MASTRINKARTPSMTSDKTLDNLSALPVDYALLRGKRARTLRHLVERFEAYRSL